MVRRSPSAVSLTFELSLQAQRVQLRQLAADFAGFHARGADILALAIAGNHGLDPLDIRIPSTASTTLGVRDIVTKARSLATDIAYRCHDDS